MNYSDLREALEAMDMAEHELEYFSTPETEEKLREKYHKACRV
jgi:hypothetical protein